MSVISISPWLLINECFLKILVDGCGRSHFCVWTAIITWVVLRPLLLTCPMPHENPKSQFVLMISTRRGSGNPIPWDAALPQIWTVLFNLCQTMVNVLFMWTYDEMDPYLTENFVPVIQILWIVNESSYNGFPLHHLWNVSGKFKHNYVIKYRMSTESQR